MIKCSTALWFANEREERVAQKKALAYSTLLCRSAQNTHHFYYHTFFACSEQVIK